MAAAQKAKASPLIAWRRDAAAIKPAATPQPWAVDAVAPEILPGLWPVALPLRFAS